MLDKIIPRLKEIEERVKELETSLASPEVTCDPSRLQQLAKERAALIPLLSAWEEYKKIVAETDEINQLEKEKSGDAEIVALYEEEKRHLALKKEMVEKRIEALLLDGTDQDKDRPAIVEIRAGTGGEEAALFVADLYRMYIKWAAERGLRVEVMNTNPTGRGGLKEVIFSVSGRGAFQSFKYESGTHRVQRVPETEASGRIHTSAVTVAVLPEPEAVEVDIKPEDLRIDVFRSSGPGGQHVNKTESAVRITHVPTGIVVSCQDEKSQYKNKAKAMRILSARIVEIRKKEEEAKRSKDRKSQVGSGDRSEKIRTYNFPDHRVTDHRIGLTVQNLANIMEGHLEPIFEALLKDERERTMVNGGKVA
ncbi:MAG: peptide chain release factor 1 [Candidatus Omnitrophica bacterium]|nr:peptide chain release factor 1 [Candidatus Omnitrophota bacterium]